MQIGKVFENSTTTISRCFTEFQVEISEYSDAPFSSLGLASVLFLISMVLVFLLFKLSSCLVV